MIDQLLSSNVYQALVNASSPSAINPYITASVITSGYVPYIGATSNLNLGTFSLTAGLGQFGAGTNSGRQVEIFQDSANVKIGSLVGTPTSSAIYLNQTTPSATNYTIASDGSNTYINSVSLSLLTNNVVRLNISSSGNLTIGNTSSNIHNIYGTTRINYSDSVYQSLSTNSGGDLSINSLGANNKITINSTLQAYNNNPADDSKIKFTKTGSHIFAISQNAGSLYFNKVSGGYYLFMNNDGTLGLGNVSTNININGYSTAGTYGGGSGVIYIGNATTIPTSNPSGGGLLYIEAGVLKYRGPSGTVTTVAVA